MWLSKVQGKSALDYGSGLGFSTEFLMRKGFYPKGADINPTMVTQAKKSYPTVDFSLIKNHKLPFGKENFDLVFSSLVLWFEKDYREAFRRAGLPICEVHYPLGREGEPYPWQDELKESPFLFYYSRLSRAIG